MTRQTKLLGILTALFLIPAVSYAQLGVIDTFFTNLISFMNKILVPLIFAVALVSFLWAVVVYFIYGATDENKRSQAKNVAMYAVIGFVLMSAIWGIVNFLATGISSGFGLEEEKINNLETIPGVPAR